MACGKGRGDHWAYHPHGPFGLTGIDSSARVAFLILEDYTVSLVRRLGSGTAMELKQSLKGVAVNALRLTSPVALDAETPTREVVRAMRKAKSGYALMLNGKKLAGIFTERDVLTKVLDVEGALEEPASSHMTPDPVSVHSNDPIHRAAWHMHNGGFRSVPVLEEDGTVVGCVRHRDLIRFLVDHLAEHALNLPPDPDQRARAPEGG